MSGIWNASHNWSLNEPSVLLSSHYNNNSHNENVYVFYENVLSASKGLGNLFYFVKPWEFMYTSMNDVPKIFHQAWPYFLFFLLLENIILWIECKPTQRINTTITSLSQGLLQECTRLLLRGAESVLYVYIYENYRVADLPWNSAITWYAAAIGVDFCYYWMHRASHEIHILWAQHQVHHSSEDFNLSVALRQSFLQNAFGSVLYLPLAFFIPPTQFLTHHQFNLLFQFWIHTEVVRTVGPLEWILNTPKHHRVHHGSNLYCLDKNYGGVFILWDRLFGTFADEKENEEIVYGLVVNQPSFNPFFLQTFYTAYVFEKAREMTSWRHKLAAVFYGPSWLPGRPRLGCDADKIDVKPRERFDVQIPTWCNVYLIVHFTVVVLGFQELAARHMGLNPFVVFGFVIYILLSLTAIGMLFENSPNATTFELIRCLMMVTLLQIRPDLALSPVIVTLLQVFFILSSIFWTVQTLYVLQNNRKVKML